MQRSSYIAVFRSVSYTPAHSSRMPNFVAHKIYTEHLSKLGKGLPVWFPEPDPRVGEVQIGDVGIFLDGQFKRLFNVISGAIDDSLPLPDELSDAPRLQYNPALEGGAERYMNPGPYSDSINITGTLQAGLQGGYVPFHSSRKPRTNHALGHWCQRDRHLWGGDLSRPMVPEAYSSYTTSPKRAS